jgi:hypothetical protein
MAGWAFPISFYILPLSYPYRFIWVVVIESPFWMKPAGGAGLRQTVSILPRLAASALVAAHEACLGCMQYGMN